MKTVLLFVLMAGALSAHAADPKTYLVDISMVSAAGISTPRVQVKEGESFKIVTGEEDAKISASFTVSAAANGSVKLAGSVRCADGAAATPTLIARLGEAATVSIDGPAEARCRLTMTVTEESQPASPK